MEQTFYVGMGWHGANLQNQIGNQKDNEHNALLCIRRHGVNLMQLTQEEKVDDFQEVMGI